MAEYLNAKRNPKTGYEDDTCIFIKVGWIENYPKRSYLDIVDAGRWLEWAKAHPTIKVIASSVVAKNFLSEYLNRDVVLIPHHHCNFERWVRPDREVKTVGILGSINSFRYPVEKFRKQLSEIGLELKVGRGLRTREEVVEFYKSIDIHVTWRYKVSYARLKNTLKLSNACSFGIPTVACPERAYINEYGGYYIPARTIDELISSIKFLKDNHTFYREYADKGVIKAEAYHIENISKLYLKL